MIEPITMALAAGAGASAVQSVANSASSSASLFANAVSPSASSEFNKAMREATRTSFRKLFANNPTQAAQLQSELGSGPYRITENTDGTLTLTSNSGATATLDRTTPLGQQAISLAQTVGLAKYQDGVTLKSLVA